MNEAQLIEAIHAGPCRFVLALTGGGTGAIGKLLAQPGGSRTLIEAIVPYHEQSLIDFLGHCPEQFCAPATSQALASRAWQRGTWLRPGEPVVGVGCTASLVSDRPKRGDHRCHVSTRSNDNAATYSLTLKKGVRTRFEEETVVALVVLHAVAAAAGVDAPLPLPLGEDEAVTTELTPLHDPVARLIAGALPAVQIRRDGTLSLSGSTPQAVLPGAFNPVHAGHWHLASVAARLLDKPVAFELSVANVDKPMLTAEEVRRRAVPFAWKAELWLTRAATFREKATLFSGTTFVVGADTARRVIDPRYYDHSEERMAEALATIHSAGCRFLVGGREDAAGQFVTAETLLLPEAYRDLFQGIAAADFRVAVSSTALRQQTARPVAAPGA